MYLPFQNFVFRTPGLPVSAFFVEMERLEKEESYWKLFLQNPLLQEAIFLASPVLYEEMGKFLSGYLTKEKEVEKLKNAVLRYFSRMCSRCTPFGLFAGFSMGKFQDFFNHKEHKEITKNTKNNDTQIILPPLSNYSRYTRLDMHYLCALAQDIGKKEEIRKNVKYYPNSSLYVLGDQLRYVEYFYKKSKRIHQISSVDFSEYLEKIITLAQKGVLFEELSSLVIRMLPEENISPEEAEGFITELIGNQILISDLEPEITGKDFLVQVLNVLQEIPRYARNDVQRNEEPPTSERFPLFQLATLLKQMDTQPLGKSIPLYHEAEEIVKTTETAYEKNYLFQVDMFKPVEGAVLDPKMADEILEAITLMNQLTLAPKETTLTKFAENFYERYEECEMCSATRLNYFISNICFNRAICSSLDAISFS